jgi:glucose-1-phosphate thymidylyltransferase
MRRDDTGVELDPDQARAADHGLKGMIPVGRPFLDYVLSALGDAGLTDVCLVIGPEHHSVREHFTSGVRLTRLRIRFAVQEEPRGTADAVAAAHEVTGDSSFLALNADNYYPADALRLLAQVDGAGLVGFERYGLLAASNIPADRLRRFALVDTDDDGYLRGIIEKPDDVTYERLIERSLISMNLWAFTPAIFDACARVTPSARGEYELQDAVGIARSQLGERFRVMRCSSGVLDLSTRGDVAAVAARLAGVDVRL